MKSPAKSRAAEPATAGASVRARARAGASEISSEEAAPAAEAATEGAEAGKKDEKGGALDAAGAGPADRLPPPPRHPHLAHGEGALGLSRRWWCQPGARHGALVGSFGWFWGAGQRGKSVCGR